ncbi:Putative amidoligase enzyme [Roseivivax jejudonensis]|uniref:Putative amidoligase enzyme n=1 Tax=Roseivivax jejudonensis TaxID=1529041 RepID=A0A1X6Z1R1_9RHOB|nr:amidoligase family protein [Roseivivax jejudonensis]SLN37388.1 Putative amidoligase enzyme [Roseivivax jejudonensis]
MPDRTPPKIAELPRPDTREGTPRRVGVEIELGGLEERRVAEIAADTLGGEIGLGGEKGFVVQGSAAGDLEIYLDTALLKRPEGWLGESLHSVARTVVPVEIVTSPIAPADIAALDRLLGALHAAGATGTASGLFAGYGVHFNPEVVSTDLSDVQPVLSAYAFCEDALRREMEIDIARRALPFVDPYPRALLDGLAKGVIPDMAALIDLYLERAPSRNHGLDMLCLFAHIDRDRVAQKLDLSSIAARPTFHYRLPDCRIDEPDWSLALEWNRWVRIERIAEDSGLVRELAREWRAHRDSLTSVRGDWTRKVAARLGDVA